jgi:hypothetical protein
MKIRWFSGSGKQSLVSIMSKPETTTFTKEQEIDNILIDSSLYLGMSPADRQVLLHYIVSFYFNLLPVENSRALPAAMRTGSAM